MDIASSNIHQEELTKVLTDAQVQEVYKLISPTASSRTWGYTDTSDFMTVENIRRAIEADLGERVIIDERLIRQQDAVNIMVFAIGADGGIHDCTIYNDVARKLIVDCARARSSITMVNFGQ